MRCVGFDVYWLLIVRRFRLAHRLRVLNYSLAVRRCVSNDAQGLGIGRGDDKHWCIVLGVRWRLIVDWTRGGFEWGMQILHVLGVLDVALVLKILQVFVCCVFGMQILHSFRVLKTLLFIQILRVSVVARLIRVLLAYGGHHQDVGSPV